MSDTKTIFMPDNGGCDATTMAMLSNANNQWNNPFMYLIWLALFRNGNLFGNGSEGNAQLSAIQDTLNSQATNNLVMDAIKGNAGAISSLSQQLGCSADQITAAINCVNNSVTAMGYQNQLSNCQQTNAINSNFAQTNYNMATQCCETKQAIKDNTAAVIAKLDAIEDSRKDREINALTAQLASATARAERQAELAPIVAQLNNISAKQPSTATVPYPNLIGVPASQFYGYNAIGTNGLWS